MLREIYTHFFVFIEKFVKNSWHKNIASTEIKRSKNKNDKKFRKIQKKEIQNPLFDKNNNSADRDFLNFYTTHY